METNYISLFSPDTLMILRGVMPCLVVIFLGYLTGKADRSEHEKTLSSLIFFVFSPCLVFSGIHRHTFGLYEVVALSMAAFLVVLILVPPSIFARRLNKASGGGHILPMIFGSTGTLLMPLAYLLYGNEGLAKAAMFHLFSSIFFYTFGTWLIDGRMQPGRFFRSPTFFAATIAIISVELNVTLPGSLEGFFRLVERGIDLVGYGAIPFLLLSFGYPFSKVELITLRKGIAGGIVRMFAGPLAAFMIVLFIRQLGILPTAKGYDILDYIDRRTTECVIILAGAIPGAISCYIVNRRNNPDTAATSLSILMVSSIIGIVSIPLTIYLINRFILSA